MGLGAVRFWSLKRWIAVLALGVAAVVAVAFVALLVRSDDAFNAARKAAPVAAATIALVSLVATSVSLTANWRRQKRQESIDAWNEWSDGSLEPRQRLTQALGMSSISTEVGQALAENTAFTDGTVDLSDDEHRMGVRRDFVAVLNGLERLAVGVSLGVYDEATIRKLGGTIIVREWDRAHHYVLARRTSSDPLRKQERAFVELEALVNAILSRKLAADKSEVDRQRLENLKRARRG